MSVASRVSVDEGGGGGSPFHGVGEVAQVAAFLRIVTELGHERYDLKLWIGDGCEGAAYLPS